MRKVGAEGRVCKASFRKGFTLIELLVVVVILAIITAIAIPFTGRTVRSLRQHELDSKARSIYLAAQNRIIELRASGRQSLYFNVDNSKSAGSGSMRYVASYDSSTNAIGIFGGDLVEYEVQRNNWVIVFDSCSGSIKEVFYSEKAFDYDPSSFDSLRDYENRLSAGARIGFYGGETVSINMTYTLIPEITIENGEKLIAHLSCVSPDSSPLTFYLKVTDESGASESVTVTPSYFGSRYTYDFIVDSLNDSQHFKDIFPALRPGDNVTIELRAESTSTYIDDGTASVVANSLFASLDSDTAVVTACRHLQNLDVSTSGVSDSVRNVVQKSSLWFGNTTNSKDWYDTYGTKSFKPIVNPHLSSYDGSYKSVKTVVEGGVEKTKEEIVSTVIYDLNISVTDGAPAGLFGSLSSNQELSLRNVYLCNAYIKSGYESDYGAFAGNTGALVGNMGGYDGMYVKLSIDGCRVYLDKTKGNINNETYIDGNRVGGLVGAALSGELSITNSFAATVIGKREKTSVGGGLIGLVVYADTDIDRSYADCYINAQSTGGLIGDTADASAVVGIKLNNCYAAGYLNAESAGSEGTDGIVHIGAAGLIHGVVTESHNVYTVCNIAAPNEANYYTTFKSAIGSNVSKTYFLEKRSENALPDILNTAQKTYSELNDAYSYGWLLSNEFTRGNSGLNTNAYNLKKQGLTDYSYPRIKELPHYGDWKADFETGALVYYEEYSDGLFGFYGANTDTLRDDTDIVGDGYAIVFAKTPVQTVWEANVIVDGGYNGWIGFNDSNRRYISSVEGGEEDYVIYTLPRECSDPDRTDSGFYQNIKIEAGGVTKNYYFNPHFAKCITEAGDVGDIPAVSSAISVRTARHLYNMGRYYDKFIESTKNSSFIQEHDISYISYKWNEYAKNGKPSEQKPIGLSRAGAFKANYDGSSHIIDIDVPVRGSEYVGLFGYNKGNIKNVSLIFRNDAGVERTGSIKAAGSFTGANDGSISGCLTSGAVISLSAISDGNVSVGGFVGANMSDGIIIDCAAQTDLINAEVNGAVLHAGGFAGENLGSILDCDALSCVDVTSNAGTAMVGGFVSMNSGNVSEGRCASALMPRDYVRIFGFSAEGYGDLTDCRYLYGGIYGYCDVICPYSYQQESLGADKADYTVLTAEFVRHMETFGDGKDRFGGWLFKPELGTAGVFYWEKCDSGCRISYIGSHDGEGRYDSNLCTDRACSGITDSGYGCYCKGDLVIGGIYEKNPAPTEIEYAVCDLLGDNSMNVYVCGSEDVSEWEIKYSSDGCIFGYMFEVDKRFGDAFRYIGINAYRNSNCCFEIQPSDSETADFGGRNDSFLDYGCKVRTFDQLQNVCRAADRSYTVTHNISGSYFNPIGSQDMPFTGSFDGGGYTIKGLQIAAQDNVGLFGYTINASISNVVLIDGECNAQWNSSIGAIAGYAEGGSIVNCCAGMRINTNWLNSITAGGILGSGSAKVYGCTSFCTLVGDNSVGNLIYSISGGFDTADCFALDIACNGTVDYPLGNGVTFIKWDAFKDRLAQNGVFSDRYPEGAVYWVNPVTAIKGDSGVQYNISIAAIGETGEWRYKLVSETGQEAYIADINTAPDRNSVVLYMYGAAAGEYRLIAYTDDGMASECTLIIDPDITDQQGQ